MTPAILLLITEVIRVVGEHLSTTGKYNSLTEDQARATAAKIGAALIDSLPTPEELEKS